MINGIHTLDDYDLKGKTVLLREDMNSPLDSGTREPRDITRIKESLPSIKELAEKGARTVVLIHQGNDIEYHSFWFHPAACADRGPDARPARGFR